jgi:uncharacterized membrane protein
MRPVLSLVLLFVTGTWLVALVAAPYAATHHDPDTTTFRSAGLVYVLGSVVCHQLAHRSFHLWGVQLPVCARCTGLYAGAAFGALWAFVGRRGRQRSGSSNEIRRIRQGLVVAALPTALAIVAELLGAAEPSGVARASAALPLGAGVSWVVGLTLQGRLQGHGID